MVTTMHAQPITASTMAVLFIMSALTCGSGGGPDWELWHGLFMVIYATDSPPPGGIVNRMDCPFAFSPTK